MNRAAKWALAAAICAVAAVSSVGCMKSSGTNKSDTGDTGSPAKKKNKDEPPVRVEEKYGFTSQGAGG